MKSFLLLVLAICVFGVFYFSWLPKPDLCTETYLPSWLRNWSNYYYNLRTAVPFVAIGFLLEVARGRNSRTGTSTKRYRLFFQNTGIAAVVVCIAEGGQFLLKNRSPDWMDVFFGIVGNVIGSLLYYILQILMKFKSIQNEK
jgi:glycopeptide antibiotics resistance protein